MHRLTGWRALLWAAALGLVGCEAEEAAPAGVHCEDDFDCFNGTYCVARRCVVRDAGTDSGRPADGGGRDARPRDAEPDAWRPDSGGDAARADAAPDAHLPDAARADAEVDADLDADLDDAADVPPLTPDFALPDADALDAGPDAWLDLDMAVDAAPDAAPPPDAARDAAPDAFYEPPTCPPRIGWDRDAVLWVSTGGGLRGFSLVPVFRGLPIVPARDEVVRLGAFAADSEMVPLRVHPDGYGALAFVDGPAPQAGSLFHADLRVPRWEDADRGIPGLQGTRIGAAAQRATALRISADGTEALVGLRSLLGDGGEVAWLDLVTGRRVDLRPAVPAEENLPVRDLRDVALDGTGRAFVSAGGVVEEIELDGERSVVVSHPQEQAGPIAAAPGHLVAGVGGGLARVDLITEPPRLTWQGDPRRLDHLLAVAVMPDGRDVFAVRLLGNRTELELHRPGAAVPTWTARLGLWRAGDRQRLVFSHDGLLVMHLQAGDDLVRIFDRQTGAALGVLDLDQPIHDIATRGAFADPERCNGEDDDCDGVADESFGIGDACDPAGACGVGVLECAGPLASRCSTGPGGSESQVRAEVCNDLDDDCDGRVDEDPPDIAGPPLQLTLGGAPKLAPVMVWTGNGYGLGWAEDLGDRRAILFQLLDSAGRPLGQPRVLGEGAGVRPELRLGTSGDGFAVTWMTADTVLLQMLDAAGTPLFAPARDLMVPSPDVEALGEIVWTGDRYTVLFSSGGLTPAVTRLIVLPMGQQVGRSNIQSPGLDSRISGVWTGDTLGYVYRDEIGDLAFYSRGASAISATVPAVAPGPWPGPDLRMGLTWAPPSGEFAAFFWSTGERRLRMSRITFQGAVSADLAQTARDVRAVRATWADTEHGVLWADDRAGGGGLYFMRVDASGRVPHAPLRVTPPGPQPGVPTLAWNGTDYAAAYTAPVDGVPQLYWVSGPFGCRVRP